MTPPGFYYEKRLCLCARLPVYNISDLEYLESRYTGNPLFKIINIGSTMEKRPLEIIQIGRSDAKYSSLYGQGLMHGKQAETGS